ncbi:serine hydrolase [Parasphingorhabdus sp.]|uniref:serine hydrolase domain-containing protein n=1 Tax=Parasphingorhabdus sp. TaxID=2709688 RepID=UPI003266F5C6
MYKIIALAAACIACPAASQEAGSAWPSAEQVKMVDERLANFPIQTSVKDIDWYQPQEAVVGGNAAKLQPTHKPTISASAIEKAVALAESEKSYALLTWKDGELQLEKYWYDFGQSSRYTTASMAKTVVALAVGTAVAEGHIGSVDDPISDYISTMKNTRRGSMSIRAFLEMASGMQTPGGTRTTDGPYWQYSLGDDIGEATARWPDSCVPLKEFCYANGSTAMLGWAIEGATGMRYADWLSRTVWQPIGASDATLWLDRENGSPRYSCCLLANAQDWLRVGLLFLNQGQVGKDQIVPQDWIKRMTAASPANPNYGWQVWRGSPHAPQRSYGKGINAKVAAAEPFARDDVYYLDGSAGQRVYIVPSENLVIVRIGAPSFTWDDSALPNIILAGIN